MPAFARTTPADTVILHVRYVCGYPFCGYYAVYGSYLPTTPRSATLPGYGFTCVPVWLVVTTAVVYYRLPHTRSAVTSVTTGYGSWFPQLIPVRLRAVTRYTFTGYTHTRSVAVTVPLRVATHRTRGYSSPHFDTFIYIYRLHTALPFTVPVGYRTHVCLPRLVTHVTHAFTAHRTPVAVTAPGSGLPVYYVPGYAHGYLYRARLPIAVLPLLVRVTCARAFTPFTPALLRSAVRVCLPALHCYVPHAPVTVWLRIPTIRFTACVAVALPHVGCYICGCWHTAHAVVDLYTLPLRFVRLPHLRLVAFAVHTCYRTRSHTTLLPIRTAHRVHTRLPRGLPRRITPVLVTVTRWFTAYLRLLRLHVAAATLRLPRGSCTPPFATFTTTPVDLYILPVRLRFPVTTGYLRLVTGCTRWFWFCSLPRVLGLPRLVARLPFGYCGYAVIRTTCVHLCLLRLVGLFTRVYVGLRFAVYAFRFGCTVLPFYVTATVTARTHPTYLTLPHLPRSVRFPLSLPLRSATVLYTVLTVGSFIHAVLPCTLYHTTVYRFTRLLPYLVTVHALLLVRLVTTRYHTFVTFTYTHACVAAHTRLRLQFFTYTHTCGSAGLLV